MEQLRFKVGYYIPQISLPAELWPSEAPFIPSYSQARDQLPWGKDATHRVPYSPGEASWVSFCRATQRSCFRALRYQMVAGDADRYRSDFSVIPIQVSQRDIIVIAIFFGMRITYTNNEVAENSSPRSVSGRISMRGRAGTITSAEHPILGAIMHYIPDDIQWRHRLSDTGNIPSIWMSRLWGDIPVAGKTFDDRERTNIEKSECKWLLLARSNPENKSSNDLDEKTRSFAGLDVVLSSGGNTRKCPSEQKAASTADRDKTSHINDSQMLLPLQPGPHDGEWRFSDMIPNHRRTTLFSNEESSGKPPRMHSNQHQAPGAATGPIEDDICRWRDAQASQTLRRSKAHE
jgi:hypothetical protein